MADSIRRDETEDQLNIDHHEKKKKEKHDWEKEAEQLKHKIEHLAQEKQDLEEAYKRKAAEFDNYRRRTSKEIEDMRFQANKKLLQHILPVYDNFQRALATLETTSKENLHKGLSIIYAEFEKVLENAGVKPIPSVGKEFDYNCHEALMMEESEDVAYAMTVIQELERGYMLGEEVLRPSKVKVGKKVNRQTESQNEKRIEEGKGE